MVSKLGPDDVKLLKEKHLAQFVTLMEDGSPHIAPVWVDTDGEHVLINTEEGRVKVANMQRDPRVAVSVYDEANPSTRVLNIRGRVVEITAEGARDHIDQLSEKYTGRKPYGAHNPDKDRLIVKVEPESIY